jgi:hypothetical protein
MQVKAVYTKSQYQIKKYNPGIATTLSTPESYCPDISVTLFPRRSYCPGITAILFLSRYLTDTVLFHAES